MQNFHPLFVHFPIVLLLVVPLLDLIGILRRKEWYHRAALLVLVLGTLAAVAAVTTGLSAEGSVSHTDTAHRIMEVHRTFALTLLGVTVVLLGWRASAQRRLLRKEMVAVLLVEMLGFGALIPATAYFGGKLVYEYGIGTTLVADEAPHEHASDDDQPALPQTDSDEHDSPATSQSEQHEY